MDGLRTGTVRQRIMNILRHENLTSKEISKRISITQKEVIRHLPNVAKSLSSKGFSLNIEKPQCLDCGFMFRERSRFSKPGHCPRCKGTRITEPSFSVGLL
ncbi:MAG: hypothetical protein AUK25_06265 [Desulfobacteraceae bacterium CG2_30_51_40]|nr:MAG: hypothetical protein AUK25_06265 [Desulfobacteraceae bacterium CG2_30_51_40]